MLRKIKEVFVGPPRPDHTPVLADVYDYASRIRMKVREDRLHDD